ncbi:MAG: hypothetical protein JO235_17060 [Chroococcidiopsidaceae cyanobacterium CP_BM_RX_35]|nr:hypothetical protein [Chroococcidiopsidaceae cyanobacterium CP_BM_RX_35]
MLRCFIILAASSAVSTLCLVNSAFASPQDFVSNWVNANPNTRGITRFAIKLAGANTLSIQIFKSGSCPPDFDCSLGITKLVTYSSNVQDSHRQFARAEYGKGLNHILLILNLSGVGSKNMSRRIHLQRFTSNKSNQQRNNSSQDIFIPTAQIWPMPSPCFFQDPRRCSTKPGWIPRSRK